MDNKYLCDTYEIIGLTVSEAIEKIKPFGMTLRVMQKDGVGLMGTMEVRNNRINVATSGEKIISILRVG